MGDTPTTSQTFRPLAPKANMPVLLFWLAIVACLVGIAAYLNLSIVASNRADGLFVDPVDGDTADWFADIARLFLGVVWIAAYVMMIVWFRAAYGNVAALGDEQSRKPVWAVVGWLIPILNLLVPKALADDIANSVRSRRDDSQLSVVRVGIWWIVIVLAMIATAAALWYMYSAYFAAETTDFAAERMYAFAGAGACILGVFAAMAFIWFIRTVTKEQPAAEEAVDRRSQLALGEHPLPVAAAAGAGAGVGALVAAEASSDDEESPPASDGGDEPKGDPVPAPEPQPGGPPRFARPGIASSSSVFPSLPMPVPMPDQPGVEPESAPDPEMPGAAEIPGDTPPGGEPEEFEVPPPPPPPPPADRESALPPMVTRPPAKPEPEPEQQPRPPAPPVREGSQAPPSAPPPWLAR